MRSHILLLTALFCCQTMAADDSLRPPVPGSQPVAVGSAPQMATIHPVAPQAIDSSRRIAELEDMVRKQNQLIKLQSQKINELEQHRRP